MSLSELPPVETMTGLRVVAIFSISIQSFRSELAILMIWTPSSWHRSTEASSNGVAIVMQPALRMASTRVAVVLGAHLRVQGLLDVADVRPAPGSPGG